MAGRPSQLDDPAVRDFIVAEIEAGGNLDTAGAKLSPPLSRQAINLWMRGKPPDRAQLRERIEAARHRRNVVGSRVEAAGGQLQHATDHREQPPARPPEPTATRAPRAPTQLQARTAERMSVAVELVQDADRAPGPTVEDFIERAWSAATSPDEHPAVRAKCWGIVAEYKLGAMLFAERKRLEREAADGGKAGEAKPRKLVLELPDNGTHASRRAHEGETIDVEVIDG